MKAEDIGDREKETLLHHRVFDESTLRICIEAAGFINIAPVDNHEAMVALPQRSAGNSRSRVTNQSRAEAHSAQRPLSRDSYLGGLCAGFLVDK
ncbi:MAG: hypothetical protein DMF27_01920 [Verrucomicrobia bacterium]|nr:MAG: hypothetical protein DMF27_01920 [Verrucomicrobiota bacterium]